MEITTPRMRLVALDAAALAAYTSGRESFEKYLGLLPFGQEMEHEIVVEMLEATHFWQRGVRENPEFFFWYTNWEMILKKENIAIGGIGFGGRPDEKGTLKLGYCVDKRKRDMGYATEALNGIVGFAFSFPEVTSIVAETPVNNFPSSRVLEKAGFKRIPTGPGLNFLWELLRENLIQG